MRPPEKHNVLLSLVSFYSVSLTAELVSASVILRDFKSDFYTTNKSLRSQTNGPDLRKLGAHESLFVSTCSILHVSLFREVETEQNLVKR